MPGRLSTDDIVAIEQLLARYGHAADSADQEGVAEVFTEDAVLDATPLGGERHEGLEQLNAFFARGKPPHPPSHHTTNVYVLPESDPVRVMSKWIVVDRGHGVRTGEYRDVLSRTASGWRIAERIAFGRWVRGDISEPEPW